MSTKRKTRSTKKVLYSNMSNKKLKTTPILPENKIIIDGKEMRDIILNLILKNRSTTISGRLNVERMTMKSTDGIDYTKKYFDCDGIYSQPDALLVYVKSETRLLAELKVIEHMSPDKVNIKWHCFEKKLDRSKTIRGEKIDILFNKKNILSLICCKDTEKDNVMQTYIHDYKFIETTARGSTVHKYFDMENSSNILESILSNYKKGYTTINMKTVCNFNLRYRLEANYNQCQQGMIPIHTKDSFEKITIVTTMKAIKIFHPTLYDNIVKDGVCPLSGEEFSQNENVPKVLTNTGRLYCYEPFIELIINNNTEDESDSDYSDTFIANRKPLSCPITRLPIL